MSARRVSTLWSQIDQRAFQNRGHPCDPEMLEKLELAERPQTPPHTHQTARSQTPQTQNPPKPQQKQHYSGQIHIGTNHDTGVPKLETSRFCCVACAVVCLGITAAVCYAAWGTAASQAYAPPPPRRMPALLRRFAALRRTRKGDVDVASVFPSWVDASAVDLDLAMAIGQLARQLDDRPGMSAMVVDDGVEL